ncbi:MAG: phosphoribosylaminoimidazolesuccinocarboxamide synthase [bacterium]|nr:phosphoribosylaminoimidazolesuccinocarboxamide synthase [bacterium]
MKPAGIVALLGRHLKPLPAGKIRSSFRGPNVDGHKTRFVYVSDKISSHDFMLGFLMPRKGEVLNALTVYSKMLVSNVGIHTDLLAWGRMLDSYLPAPLRGIPEIYKTVTLVREHGMILYECIERLMLTGSAWSQYADPTNNRVVYGEQLPEGLKKNDPLPSPIWTPTTKAKKGHDLPLAKGEVLAKYPDLDTMTHLVGAPLDEGMRRTGRARYADRKFEFAFDPVQEYVLCDEVGTPDSSRIWLVGETLPNDKDYVRIAAESAFDIKRLDPLKSEDVEAVRRFQFSRLFIESAVELYLSTPALVTGRNLDQLQKDLCMA